ncbi:MAG: hypothetical protein JXA28_03100, partial [Bacteroidetes bacterium]|nr:hypothetical protein [Bacteroidota bacterium]
MTRLASALLCAMLVSLLLSAGCGDSSTRNPRADRGQIDLRHWNFSRDGAATLQGEWEFVFGRLLSSADFDSLSLREYVSVPSSWNGQRYRGRELPATGCATYRLRVFLGDSADRLSIDMPKLIAYDLFINERHIGGSGRAGCSAAESMPEFRLLIFDDIPRGDTLEVIIHVSNFQYWKGGLWKNLIIGRTKDIHDARQNAIVLDVITVTALAGFGLSLFVFFLYRRTERVMLWAALLCLIGIIRSLATGQLLILQILPWINWEWLVTLELFGFYGMAIGWFLIVNGL